MIEEKYKYIKRYKLNKMQYYVTQESGTEPPFSGKLLHNKQEGIYSCLCCHTPLFLSQSKFNAIHGWPSFYKLMNDQAVNYVDDLSHGMHRVEVRCRYCNAHLGHVFADSLQPTGQRYCINSVALIFTNQQSGEITDG